MSLPVRSCNPCGRYAGESHFGLSGIPSQSSRSTTCAANPTLTLILRERVLEDEVPADDPRDQLAQRRVGVGVGRSRDRNHRGEFGIAESGEARRRSPPAPARAPAPALRPAGPPRAAVCAEDEVDDRRVRPGRQSPPGCRRSPSPMTVKMPEPITAPMPSAVSDTGPSVFFSACLRPLRSRRSACRWTWWRKICRVSVFWRLLDCRRQVSDPR